MAEENITNALNNIDRAGGAAQQLAELLQAASRSTARNTTATDIARESARELERAQASVRQGMLGMVGVLGGLAGSLVAVGASAYTADKAFTAMTPTLDAVGTALKGTFDALGKMGSGFTAFGFSFGRASEGAAAAATLYVDVLQGALKFQLEAAQSTADQFLALTNAGATFGGGLTELQEILRGQVVPLRDGTKGFSGLGLPLQEFTKIVTSNVEALSKMPQDIRSNGLALATMTKNLYYNNKGLAALYGSVTDLSKGTAAFLSLQTQLGVNVSAIMAADDARTDKLEASAKEFLLRQKELSAITGQNAETLRREEEGRRKQIDYNLKLGRLGDVAKENVQEGMTLAGKIFGDAGAKYAEEYFATGGKVYTKEALTYQAVNQEAAQAIEGMLSGINESRDAFRENASKTFKQAAPALEAYAKDMEEYASINRAANNSVLKGMTDTASAIQQALPFINNLSGVFEQLKIDRDKIKAGLDEPMQVFVEANKSMLATRMEMDTIVIGNMAKMNEVVKALYETQLAFVKAQPDAIEAFNKIKTAGSDANAVIQEFARKLADLMGFTNPAGPAGEASTSPTNPAFGNTGGGAATGIPRLNPGDVAPNPSPFSGRNPQLQPEPDSGAGNPRTTPPAGDRRSQTQSDNREVVAVLSTLPTKIDAERMNRDVLDALSKLTSALA